jgi:predicted lysophospholipase L1 biosynthesis ABC-type transport system permease subunit
VVIGVVGDVREDGVNLEPVPTVHWPQVTLATFEGEPADQILLWSGVSYAVRSDRVGTPEFLQEVRKAVWSVNPNLPLQAVGPLSGFIAESWERTSFTLVLLGLAGAVALVLGLVGVYGVTSYGVSQRTLELGMRMVLGAEASRVRRMVLREALLMAGIGTAAGLALSLWVTRAVSSLLFGVSPTDPATFAMVAALLIAVALAASYLPARRAALVEPIQVLRAE